MVVDFAAAECSVGNLSEMDVPSWTTPAREVPFVEIPVVPRSRGKKAELKAVSELSEDVEMGDAHLSVSKKVKTPAKAKRLPKPTAKAQALRSVSEDHPTTGGEEDRSSVGPAPKRSLADSPSKVENKAKRSRSAKTLKGKEKAREEVSEMEVEPEELETDARVDLGDREFEVNTEINPQDVPGSFGRVSVLFSTMTCSLNSSWIDLQRMCQEEGQSDLCAVVAH